MSLSDALRAAALERARTNGQTVDGVVIEPSGVIDLREMAANASREINRPVRMPSLSERLASASIHDDTPLTEKALWRRLRPTEPGDDATVDLTDEAEPTVDLTERDESTDLAEPSAEAEAPTEIDAPTPFDELLPSEDDDAPGSFEPVVIDLTDIPERPEVFERNDGGEPTLRAPGTDSPVGTVACGHCGSMGQRDLYDVFSRTEYYSCADCGHMWQRLAD